jgi:hypothetical protein
MVAALLLLVLALLPAAASAEPGANMVTFAGSEELLELVYPGDLNDPGGNFHGRNREWRAYETTDNSCMTGESRVFSNININKKGHENAWGKWIIEPEGYDGTWEAVWHV